MIVSVDSDVTTPSGVCDDRYVRVITYVATDECGNESLPFTVTITVFDDTAPASLMKAYTGDKVFNRRAMLTMNMQGGGGLELWQFTNRQPLASAQNIRLGDLGIFAIKIKCPNVAEAFKYFMHNKAFVISPIQINAAGEQHFWLTDKFEWHRFTDQLARSCHPVGDGLH